LLRYNILLKNDLRRKVYGGEMVSTGAKEAEEAGSGPWPGKNMERL